MHVPEHARLVNKELEINTDTRRGCVTLHYFPDEIVLQMKIVPKLTTISHHFLKFPQKLTH